MNSSPMAKETANKIVDYFENFWEDTVKRVSLRNINRNGGGSIEYQVVVYLEDRSKRVVFDIMKRSMDSASIQYGYIGDEMYQGVFKFWMGEDINTKLDMCIADIVYSKNLVILEELPEKIRNHVHSLRGISIGKTIGIM